MDTTPPTARPRLLLVDDEPHITHILSRRLSKLGADVVVGRNGAEGFDLALEHGPSLILSDLQMPRLDGLGMAVQLAATPETANIPIVMISGRGFLLDDARLRQTKIVEVLEKPFSVTAVIAVVGRVLSWAPAAESAA